MTDDVTKPLPELFSVSWLCAIHHENDKRQDTWFLITENIIIICGQQTSPKVLATEDDESVISFTIFSYFSVKKSRLRIIPSLSIFGECRSTSYLSIFQNVILHYSDFIKEFGTLSRRVTPTITT